MLNACIHKLICWLIRNHLRSKGYEENEVFRITARLFTYYLQIVRLSQSLKWCIALHHSVLVDFSTLVCFLVWYYLFSNTAPRMSKHYFLKNHVLRYFNMQFSKNNTVPMTDKTQSVLEVRTSDFTLWAFSHFWLVWPAIR